MACQGAFCGETLVVQFLIRCPYSLVWGPVVRNGAIFDLPGGPWDLNGSLWLDMGPLWTKNRIYVA